MQKNNGLLPLSMLATAGVVKFLNFVFWLTGIYSTLFKDLDRDVMGYIVPGFIAFMASIVSLVVSLYWQILRRYKSESFGFAISALATTAIIDSIFWMVYGIAEIISRPN